MEPRVTPLTERMGTHEDLLNVRIASAREAHGKAIEARQKAGDAVDLHIAKTRLLLKTMNPKRPAEDISAMLAVSIEEEPYRTLHATWRGAQAKEKTTEYAVKNLENELEMVKYNYFNPMTGMRR